jgi:(E)-4-hydroxy-3-methylbut-2-enyl-diphosphate synthase
MVGNVGIGKGYPVAVQTMTKGDSRNVKGILREIGRASRAGADLVRIAVPDEEALRCFARIVAANSAVAAADATAVALPLIADVHFNPKLALGAIEAGANKLRINPGNISSKKELKEIADRAKERGIPIRIGVNTGSLPQGILRKFKHPTTEAIMESLSDSVKMFEDFGFADLVLSAKSSDARTTIDVYRQIRKSFPYPLHLGVTEAGLPFEGAIRSTAAMAPLLLEGIGDTIRISLTGTVVQEVTACRELLDSLRLRKRKGIRLVSCPGCGRTQIELVRLVKEVKAKLGRVEKPITVAVMGCVVNGPGEAREADYGIAGGKGKGVIFRKGEVVKTVTEEKLVDSLIKLIEKDL